MSSTTIKRHNHRVLPCNTERKIELINFLIKNNSDLYIVIVAKEAIKDFKDISLNEKIKVTTDKEWDDTITAEFDMLINYDLPEDAQIYLKRLELAKEYSLVLLEPSEHATLYPIETALGRVLVQDIIKVFETTQSKEMKKVQAKKDKKSKRYAEEIKKEQEKKEKAALKKLPPKHNVRKVVPKKEQ